MKIRNKITGEINIIKVNEDYFNIYKDDGEFVCPVTIKELNDGWEDYEEPKGYWYYDTTCGRVEKLNHNEDKEIDSSIGNCFETKEEAEKAVEKLKAWKRLKDKGISFKPKVINRRWYLAPKAKHEQATFDEAKDLFKDIMFIFGGKE